MYDPSIQPYRWAVARESGDGSGVGDFDAGRPDHTGSCWSPDGHPSGRSDVETTWIGDRLGGGHSAAGPATAEYLCLQCADGS